MLRALLLVLGLVAVVPNVKAGDAIGISTVDVVRVYDGDTLTVNLTGLYPVFGRELGVRVIGINTPEMSSSCSTPELKAAEKYKATLARDTVRDMVAKGKILVMLDLQRDKYFRLLARVEVDGVDVGETLIAKGLADRYDGGTKTSWCGR